MSKSNTSMGRRRASCIFSGRTRPSTKDSNKKSESIYKIGLSEIKLNNNINAKKMFQIIIDDYPKSKYFNKASEFLITLK